MTSETSSRTMPVGFAGLILAGGMGTRWGGPKACAELPDGVTFLARCVQVLERAGAVPVAATLPADQGFTPPEGCCALPLPEPGLDMFASVCFGLAALLEDESWSAVAILPVDHPLVRATTVQDLVLAGPPAAIPSLDGRHGHPLCLWRETAESVVSGAHAGPTLREVLRAVGAHDVAVRDSGVRANCNTPEALARALARSVLD